MRTYRKSGFSKKKNIYRERIKEQGNVGAETPLQDDGEEEFAGHDGHLRRWLLPSVGETRWGPGRVGWACCSSNQFALAQGWNTTSHYTTCGSHTCTNARRCILTHAHVTWTLQSISEGVLTQLKRTLLFDSLLFVSPSTCPRIFMGGSTKPEKRLSFVGLAEDQSCVMMEGIAAKNKAGKQNNQNNQTLLSQPEEHTFRQIKIQILHAWLSCRPASHANHPRGLISYWSRFRTTFLGWVIIWKHRQFL